jgi:hypothetical protein
MDYERAVVGKGKPVNESEMALFSECSLKCARKVLDTADIVRDASRVENRRSNGSLPVDIRLGFRQVTSVRFGVVLFPVPAHRTGQADFPHPALGKDSRSRPRKAGGPVW